MDKFFPPNQLWPGSLRNGMVALLVISILVCFYTVLTVAALGYSVTHPFVSSSRVLDMEEYYKGSSGITWGNDDGESDGFHVSLRLFVVFLEFFHLPISFYRYRSDRHHPIAALVMSILLIGSWATIAFWRAFLDFMVKEIPLSRTWLSLSYTSVAFASLIGLAYFVYLGYAAAAVHAWRREKKEKKRMRKASWGIGNGGDGNEIELGRKA